MRINFCRRSSLSFFYCISIPICIPGEVLGADGPSDNLPDRVRPVPPPGVEVLAADRQGLEAGVAELGRRIEALEAALKDKPRLLAFTPDLRIFDNAVRYALQYNEIFELKEVEAAKDALSKHDF